jgi:plastocyanin
MLLIRTLLLVMTIAGCSAQNAGSYPPTVECHCSCGQLASTAGAPGSIPAPPETVAIGVAGANAMAPAGVTSPSSVALVSPAPPAEKATSSGPRLGILRGKVTTVPASSAQHAVVYLSNAPIGKIVDAKLDDQRMNFSPFVSVLTVGGTLTYVNSEPFPDTAYSMSNEKWDFGMVESHGSRKRKFEKPGVYNVLCRLHPNQLAFLVVTPSSYFSRANKSGEFVMIDVPAGSYDVVAWAPRVKSEHKTVIVAEGEVTLDFELNR